MTKRVSVTGVVALLALGLLPGARGALEFSGYFRTGQSDLFVLTDLSDATASGWLRIGEHFRDHLLVSFDPQTEQLTVKRAAATWQLPLKATAVQEAAAEIPGPKGTMTQSGVHTDGEAVSGRVGTDSNGNSVHWFNGGRFSGGGAPVPLALGKKFGFFADLSGLPASTAVELEYLFATPPMHLPDGRVITSSYFTHSLTTNESGALPDQGISYSFDHDYELVPGKYRMEIRYQSKLLAAQEFDVVSVGEAKVSSPPGLGQPVNAPPPAPQKPDRGPETER